MIRKNTHLRIAYYHQHLHELLDLDLSPIEYMMQEFKELKERDEVSLVAMATAGFAYAAAGSQPWIACKLSIDY